MPLRRRTIARAVSLEGQGLHEGRPTRLSLVPAAGPTGIRFRRTDLAGAPAVQAVVALREERPRRTALVSGAAEVHTVEHLLAAVAGAGVTDVDIEIDQVEVPGLDGSAAPFLAAVAGAGTRDIDGDGPAPRLVLDRVVTVEDASGARIVAAPCPGRLVLEYVIDYAAEFPRGRFTLDVTPESFARELAPARTFCLEREAEALRRAGLGKGATYENTLVIGADGLPISNSLRFPDEYARHKTLDLFGDLVLLGARLEARVLAYKAGHALNAAMVRKLASLAPREGPGSRLQAPGGTSPAETTAREDSLLEPGARSLEPDPPLVPPGGGPFEPGEVSFEGHFPGFPVLPGVVSVAAMADAAGGRIASVTGARFRRMVKPGDRLFVAFEGGRGFVRAQDAEGPVCAEATIDLSPGRENL